MKSRIYLLTAEEGLLPMDERPYEAEVVLQRLLAQYPDLLAGDQMNAGDPRRWILVRREMSVPDSEGSSGRWSLDHLFLDQSGVPTLVEVKRSSDTRSRREVVAQMLDYAANAVAYWPIEQIQSEFEQSCSRQKVDPSELMREFLGNEEAESAFWQLVKTNIQAGRVRLVFVADVIPRELQRIVEFLNEQMDPAEVMAVEVRQYLGESGSVLVPRFIGRTAEAEQRKSVARATLKWDMASMLADLEERRGETAAGVAREILELAHSRDIPVEWGKGSKYGIFSVRAMSEGKKLHAFNVSSEGHIEIGFSSIAGYPPFDDLALLRELLQRYNNVPGVHFGEEFLYKWPRIPLADLDREGAIGALFAAYDWYARQF